MNSTKHIPFTTIRYYLLLSVVLIGLFLIGRANASLFHSMAEIVEIIIAGGIFMFAWNSRRFLDSSYLFVLGVAFLFVGLYSVLHLLVSDTASLGSAFSRDEGLKILMLGRFLESSSFIIAALFIKKTVQPYTLLFSYSGLALVAGYVALFAGFTPDFLTQAGTITPGCIAAEIIILIFYIISLLLLFFRRSIFRLKSLTLVTGAIFLAFLSELFFLRSPNGSDNAFLFSHLFNIVSFYLLYKAIIEAGVERPLNFLFANIKSSQRALKGKKEFAEKLIDMAQTILLVLDEKANIITFNPYLENIIGYKLAEVKGKNWIANFVSEADQMGIKRVFKQALEGRMIKDLIYPIRTRSGKERHIEWSMRAIKTDSGATGVLTSGQDITAHLSTKRQLLQYAEQLKAANSNKDKFFNIIAHDLRNPLTSIMNLGEQLAKDAVLSPRPRIKQSAEKLLNSVNRLTKLTENLLQWSRLQTGKLEFRPSRISVNDLIEPNIELLAGNAQKKNITIRSHIPNGTLVFADHTMMDSVIQNLITNAIKFTNEGGRIDVSADIDGNFVRITIKDTGIGMDREKLNSLFKIEQQQVTYGTAGERGTGLGLLLCKELVEKNNGQLLVNSQLNVGTTVLFDLPRAH